MSEEELMAEGAGLLADAVGQLSADDMDRLLRGLPSPVATELMTALLGNKLDPRRLKKVGALLVGALRNRSAVRLTLLVERLSTGILATFHSELGDRFDNPTVEDLREVLDAVLAQHPAAGVRCTLSWVVAEGMPAAEAARDLLLTDPRLRLAGWAEAS
ncbi:MAG: hypothetical protein QOD57_3311 [Actinomycetota bacterium]|nr:hypothetical protein [Actinomycetota bacterium]MDQ1497184.1 hypothetical protein [Actinomycetota bacterium]MDQ1505584.1 hypothetical protein [Actinomycetota bacterium]MDQ1565919.1 hypothetical protein [Actinomycetota bacterium]